MQTPNMPPTAKQRVERTHWAIFFSRIAWIRYASTIKPITKTVEKTLEVGHKTGIILQEGLKTKGIDKEVYLAVIGMALKAPFLLLWVV